jgi:hypothetical protein
LTAKSWRVVAFWDWLHDVHARQLQTEVLDPLADAVQLGLVTNLTDERRLASALFEAARRCR